MPLSILYGGGTAQFTEDGFKSRYCLRFQFSTWELTRMLDSHKDQCESYRGEKGDQHFQECWLLKRTLEKLKMIGDKSISKKIYFFHKNGNKTEQT